MTHAAESTALDHVLQLLADEGFDGMAQAIQILLNEAMKLERAQTLGAAPYQRVETRRGHANGFKPKSVNSRLGQLQLQVPQARGVEFYPSALERGERGERSERALKLAVAEMYVQGVSTRKVAEITRQLCGLDVSSSQVSRTAALLDEELAQWRSRPLGRTPTPVKLSSTANFIGTTHVIALIPENTNFSMRTGISALNPVDDGEWIQCGTAKKSVVLLGNHAAIGATFTGVGRTPYLLVDARYEKVRHGGSVVDCAVLVAVGITPEGTRSVLGVSVSLSEAEVHWREFFQSLIERGLHGVEMIVSDAHEGLAAARKASFAGVPWQRCQFHLQQNALQYVPKVELRKEVAADLRSVFNATDRHEADRLLELTVKKYHSSAPRLAAWLEDAVPEGLTMLALPAAYRRRLRTSNVLERLNQEIKRRTRVATLFPNEASLLRLASAVLMEISEDWETGNAYLTLDDTSSTPEKRRG